MLRRRARIAVSLARRRGTPVPPTPAASPRCSDTRNFCGYLPPAGRGPGQPWRPGTPPSAPIDPNTPTADIRIGYAR
ncbi:hypothetical protein T261_08745 [Streptomyces lydicus]|nr:hypothetical protein T261_08745 [Streptomyces lydicus]